MHSFQVPVVFTKAELSDDESMLRTTLTVWLEIMARGYSIGFTYSQTSQMSYLTMYGNTDYRVLPPETTDKTIVYYIYAEIQKKNKHKKTLLDHDR